MSDKFIGFTEFRYTRANVDEIFSWLQCNGNSISTTLRCYGQEHPEEVWKDSETTYQWAELIEQCANSIRDGVTSAQEYWEKLLERTQHHRITKKEIR